MDKNFKNFRAQGVGAKSPTDKGGFNKLPFAEEEFSKYLSENFLSKRTINEYVKYTKCFFKEHKKFNEATARKFLNKHNRIYAKAALQWYASFRNKNIRFPKVKEPQKDSSKKVYNKKELEQILNSEKFRKLGETERTILNLLFLTGKRVSEVLYIKASDLQENSIIFRVKGGYQQKVPIPEHLSAKLHKFARNTHLYGSLFYPDLKHKYHKFRNSLNEAGLSELKRTHNFRRAMINYLIKKTDVLTAKDFVGHKKFDTTMRYVDEESKKERISKAFNIITKEYG